MSTVDQEQLHDNALMAHDAVGLVKRLLELHPLSQRPPAAIPPMLTTILSQKGSQAVKASGAQQQFTAAALAQVQAAFHRDGPRQSQTSGRT